MPFETGYLGWYGDGTDVPHVQLTPRRPFEPSLTGGNLQTRRISNNYAKQKVYSANLQCTSVLIISLEIQTGPSWNLDRKSMT